MIRTIADASTAAEFLANPVAFIAHFDREPWDYQAKILRAVTERDDRGIFKKRIAVVSQPRQDGKTTLSAWLGLWRFVCDPTAEGDVISVALDRQGARRLMWDARRIIGDSPKLMSLLDDERLTKGWITLRNGREWIIKSSDAAMSRGARPATVLYDEMGWSVDDGELFQTLTAAQGAQMNPLIVITSTVSPAQYGTLWNLFEAYKVGDRHIRLLYSQENQSPLVSKEFLKEQRRLLPPGIYAREHRNQWGSGSDVYCNMDDWKVATRENPTLRKYGGPAWAFLDLGWVHDETSLSIAARPGEDVEIIKLHQWRGSKEKPLDFPGVQSDLEEMLPKFGVKHLRIESPQGVMLSQSLEIPGCRIETLHPTSKSNFENFGCLYKHLKDGTIILPNDDLLRRQLLSLTIKSTSSTSWKLVEDRRLHQDRVVSTAGAANMAKLNIEIKVLRIGYDGPNTRGEWGKKQPEIKQPMYGNPGRV